MANDDIAAHEFDMEHGVLSRLNHTNITKTPSFIECPPILKEYSNEATMKNEHRNPPFQIYAGQCSANS